MARHDDETKIGTNEARGGSNEGVVRWVLIIGLLLAVVLLSIVWITGAATQGDVESEATASGRIEAEQDNRSGTDGIVSGNGDEISAASETGETQSSAETIEN